MKENSSLRRMLGKSEIKQIVEQVVNNVVNNLLTENISDIVYFYTSLQSAYKIIHNDVMYLSSTLAGTANNNKTKELYYMSTTRVKNSDFGYSNKYNSNGVRFELDGRKLSQNFKGVPYSYWGNSMGKGYYYRSDDESFGSKQKHIRDEAEDRIYLNKPTIENFVSNYVKRIDVMLNSDDEELLKYAAMLADNKKVFIYTDKNEFNKQSNRTVNSDLMNKFSEYDALKINSKNGRGVSDYMLKWIVGLILVEEINIGNDTDKNYIFSEISKLLKKYSLDRFVNANFLGSVLYDVLAYRKDLERIVDNVQGYMDDISKSPSEEGQRVMKMLSDYFRSHKITNYYDMLEYKKKLQVERSKQYYNKIHNSYV
jgi:hypothetical protein